MAKLSLGKQPLVVSAEPSDYGNNRNMGQIATLVARRAVDAVNRQTKTGEGRKVVLDLWGVQIGVNPGDTVEKVDQTFGNKMDQMEARSYTNALMRSNACGGA